MLPEQLPLSPGAFTTAAAVRNAGRGASETRICIARGLPSIFLFADPGARRLRGFHLFDGWAEEDDRGPVFHLTSVGALGGHRLTLGNRALLDHREHGRALHLFAADGPSGSPVDPVRQRYLGEFLVDPTEPHLERRAPALGPGNRTRRVFVFRLRPVPGRPFQRDDRDGTATPEEHAAAAARTWFVSYR
ncbi:hypothetical protein ACIRS1_17915 [Kitasatospora sp. NPDC101176]|uniref:hypothetical protein n=1 Tax=Kitasatospora sp. NPDC101176 TaxID=3364099 RepID=UPI0038274F0C